MINGEDIQDTICTNDHVIVSMFWNILAIFRFKMYEMNQAMI